MKILHYTSRVECKDNISSYIASTKYVLCIYNECRNVIYRYTKHKDTSCLQYSDKNQQTITVKTETASNNI